MNKTLLDEFAMAALNGLLANYGEGYYKDEAAHLAYEYAEAMMAERAKRTPQPEPKPEQSTTSVYEDDESEKLIDAVASFAGCKVTCSDVHKKAFGHDGDTKSLREIGAMLRQMGFAKVRSGGKDCYQL